jgi:hypothetical protein
VEVRLRFISLPLKQFLKLVYALRIVEIN